MREHVRADQHANLHVIVLIRAHQRRNRIRIGKVRVHLQRRLIVEGIRHVTGAADAQGDGLVVVIDGLRAGERYVSGAHQPRPDLVEFRKARGVDCVIRITPAFVFRGIGTGLAKQRRTRVADPETRA